jgi:hypothetical protein
MPQWTENSLCRTRRNRHLAEAIKVLCIIGPRKIKAATDAP